MTPIIFTVHGSVTSLKNSRRLVRKPRTGKPFSIKSADAERYVTDMIAQVPLKYRGLKVGSKDQLLRAVITVYYPDWRNDLDCAIIFDALQLAGVIANDRWVTEQFLYRMIDAKNPRAEIIVEEI